MSFSNCALPKVTLESTLRNHLQGTKHTKAVVDVIINGNATKVLRTGKRG
jgi:intracellular sulfur oxidation DsrE/DsrF family protein